MAAFCGQTGGYVKRWRKMKERMKEKNMIKGNIGKTRNKKDKNKLTL